MKALTSVHIPEMIRYGATTFAHSSETTLSRSLHRPLKGKIPPGSLALPSIKPWMAMKPLKPMLNAAPIAMGAPQHIAALTDLEMEFKPLHMLVLVREELCILGSIV